MPELPDVETFRRYLASTALHKKIKEVEVNSLAILEDVSASELKKRLQGRQFEDARRHGKYLAAILDNNGCLVMHFGMTGFLKYFKDERKEPPHERLLISFANGYHLAYDCQRKLGHIRLVDDFAHFIEEKALGPDALDPDLGFAAFQKAAVGRQASIKSFLMNQEVLAGIGNVYSDEILFQAKIPPKIRADRLPDKALQRLFSVRKEVLETAIAHQANPDEFPQSYLTRHRGRSGECPKCGTPIEKTQVSGRTAYYCPDCQKP
jgi:formamidopyrimidine-DNA glycosylase